ncbi:Elongation factor 2 [Diplonema papillatum]|nr:Elongation factor 2 [Diplonema papillatum]
MAAALETPKLCLQKVATEAEGVVLCGAGCEDVVGGLPEARCVLRGATEEETLRLVQNARFVRNVAVVAHVDAGKSTLSDVLLKQSGLVSETASCALDSLEEEKARGITIKAAAVTLGYRGMLLPDNSCVINLIDCPGHVDFSSEVTASLRVADGAFAVVDAVEGMQVQTEAVVKLCLTQKVVPALVFNKIDRLILQLQLPSEEIYQRLSQTEDSLSRLCGECRIEGFESTCREQLGRGVAPNAQEGTVVFASGLQGWGFTLDTFARLWSEKVGTSAETLRKKMWGDCFYSLRSKRFTSSGVAEDGAVHQRGFCKLILEPILKIKDVCAEVVAVGAGEEGVDVTRLGAVIGTLWAHDAVEAGCAAARAAVKQEEGAGSSLGNAVFHAVLRSLLPAARSLVEVASRRLPSAKVAQAYRADVLVGSDDNDDELGYDSDGYDDLKEMRAAVAACDANGPLVAYVTKMVPVNKTWGFHAFGRVFSGTVAGGKEVVVVETGTRTRVQATVMLMGAKEQRVALACAGCPAAFAGISDSLVKCGTLCDAAVSEKKKKKTTKQKSRSRGMLEVQHQLTPVVQAAVECAQSSDRLHLTKAMKWVAQSDPLVQCFMNSSSGEAVVAAGGELHLEVTLNTLKKRMNGPPSSTDCGGGNSNRALRVSEAAVAYRETVTVHCEGSCLAKSSNKHNRIYASASPMDDELVAAIERREVTTPAQAAAYGLKNVWCLSLQEAGANVLVNNTCGVALINEIRTHVVNAFKQAMTHGPVCHEPCRGIRIDITDAVVHSDPAHRGPAEICPAARRAMAAAVLSSSPALYEPLLQCSVATSAACAGTVRSALPKRRGAVVDESYSASGDAVVITGHLPVQASFGITQQLRSASSGRSTFHGVFSHWAVLPPHLFSEAAAATSARKKLSPLPSAEQLIDKL